jgi:hypothetical protein
MKKNESHTTAYALGELHGAERAAFEAELAASPELQKELAEVSRVASLLEALPPGEPAFTEAERAALREKGLAQLHQTAPPKVLPFPWPRRLVVLAAAAVLLLGLFVFLPERQEETSAQLVAAEGRVEGLALAAAPEQPGEPRSQTAAGAPAAPVAAPAAGGAEVVFSVTADEVHGPLDVTSGVGDLAEFDALAAVEVPLARGAVPPARAERSDAVAQFRSGWGAGQGSGVGVRARTAEAGAEAGAEAADGFSMVRRFLQAGQLPPAEAIRLEEMIQYSAIDDSSEEDSRFVAAVASFARKLLGTPEADDLSWEEIESIAREAHAADSGSRRAELLALVEKARQLLVQRDSSGQ